jgi:hypothetical protein
MALPFYLVASMGEAEDSKNPVDINFFAALMRVLNQTRCPPMSKVKEPKKGYCTFDLN